MPEGAGQSPRAGAQTDHLAGLRDEGQCDGAVLTQARASENGAGLLDGPLHAGAAARHGRALRSRRKE